MAERWEADEGAREVVEIMEVRELEEGLRRRREEPGTLRADPGVRGVRGARSPSRLEEELAAARVVSMRRWVTGIPRHAYECGYVWD